MSDGTTSKWMPASILIGAGIVALGLYLGLRERGEAPPPSVPTASSTINAAPSPGPMGVPAPLPTAVPASASVASPPSPVEAQRARAAKELDAWIGAQKKALTTTCWAPSHTANATPASAVFRLRFLLEMTGRASSVSADQTAESRKDVGECLQRELADAKVTAPSEPIGVQVELTLP